MAEKKFYLNDVEVEEPNGFAALEISILRDEKFHGIGFEASTGTLEFDEEGADILRSAKETLGLKANVIFRAEMICNAYQEEENFYTGRVNFGTYQEKCGDSCSISVGVEEVSCIVTLRSRMDQKVDLDSLIAFDKITAIGNYAAMGNEITLPAVQLETKIEGYVGTVEEREIEILEPSGGFLMQVRPDYDDERFNSIQIGNLTSGYRDAQGETFGAISPQLLFQDIAVCFDGTFDYEFRMAGTTKINKSGTFTIIFEIYKVPSQVNFTDGTLIDSVTIHSGSYTANSIISLDEILTGTIAMNTDDSLYGQLIYAGPSDGSTIVYITFNTDTYVLIESPKICPGTQSEVYMIHETLSRVTESITNGCARVKSEYYGRTDSEPFSFDADGCGGLRFSTSGLKIRRAEKDFFFASFTQLINGLNAIDNIGFGIEDDPVLPDKKVVRIEDLEHFYQDDVTILTIPAIPSALSEVQEGMYWSVMKTGYQKWQVERINGLDEINSSREYRTDFDVVNNVLEAESELVTGSYPFELTRQQSFAATGAADTTYDNDIFLACVRRLGYGTFEVETGNVSTSTDLYSPGTKYNVRISPARNALRWFRTMAAGYINLPDTANKIYFSSGDGNISACTQINNAYLDHCINESGILCENQDLHISQFADSSKGTPLWKPETITFDYPLSLRDYRTIKANPYGKISYQCGNGPFKEGWIKEIKYRPNDGEATFILIKKYGV